MLSPKGISKSKNYLIPQPSSYKFRKSLKLSRKLYKSETVDEKKNTYHSVKLHSNATLMKQFEKPSFSDKHTSLSLFGKN